MYRLITKQSRLEAQQSQINVLTEKGYVQEIYKGLKILTHDDGKSWTLKIFKDSASHAIAYYYYRKPEDRSAAIERYKDSYDRGEDWKNKRDENNKLEKVEAEKKAASGEQVTASVKKTSSLVKKLLKEKFNIEVSVRSESYSGGSSINIDWNLGADSSEVENLVSELSYGTFDSYTDCAGCRDTQPIVVDGFTLHTFRFLFVRQSMSKEFRYKLIKLFSDNFKFEGAHEVNALEDITSSFPEMVWSAWTWDNLFYQHFKKSNWITQDENEINLISCKWAEGGRCELEYIYEVNGKQYSTQNLIQAEVKQEVKPNYEAVEVEAGTVNIVDYSDKAFAVIGDTKPIKDLLKSLGGRFNFRLTCGPGWIFPKTKLNDVTAALSQPAPEIQELQKEVKKTVDFFAQTDMKLLGAVSESTKDCATVQNVIINEPNYLDLYSNY